MSSFVSPSVLTDLGFWKLFKRSQKGKIRVALRLLFFGQVSPIK